MPGRRTHQVVVARSLSSRRSALASALEPLETRTLLTGVPPQVLGIECDTGIPAGVEVGLVKFVVVHFSADVGAPPTLADLHVRNVTAHTDVAPASLTWDAASTSAVIQFATPTLPDGNYTLTILGTTAWFSELAGDANGDRVVNFTDLLALARNYNGAGDATPAQGDFNSDRRVTFDDLLTLARSYNNTLGRSVRVAGPAEGAQVTGTVNLAADPSDVSGLAGVQFMVNGSPVGAEDTSAPYSFAWDSTSVANGSYQITAVARGTDGSTTTSEPIDITVNNPDVTPPSVSLNNPSDDATVSGTVSVAVGASDNIGVVGVQFLVDGVVVGTEDTVAPYSFSWDSKTVGDGPHTLAARARDAAGNVSTSPARWVTVANTTAGTQGQWSSVMDWPLVAINSILLKDGRFLMWDGDGTGTVCIGPTSARVWDPATGQFTPVPIPDFTGHEDDIFCSANATLADGRVLVVGGHDCDGPGLGVKATHLFDPRTMTWTRGPDMNYARWYPTATTLADGRVLVLGGSTMTTVDYVSIPEIYDPVTNTFTELENADLAIPSYSFVFQHPDGRVIVTGSDESEMPTYALDVATQTWSVVDPTELDAGSGVMYQPGKFMKAGSSYLSAPADNGGATPSKATTYVLDTTQPTPHWVQTASMAYARTHLNLTILPDGSVLATGGSSDIGGLTPANGVLPAELWSPVTKTWTTMSSMATPRMYHSTANLMPDGRVLITGGGRLGPVSFPSAEIYSPAYLFKGPRPVVTSAPASVEYGSDFFVATPDGARIASVAMIRTGATTHSFNMDQRFVPLTYTVVAGGLMVHAPADSRLATPGHYMLFLVDTKGVPAVAPIIKLPAAYEDQVPPTAPTNVNATGAVGAATLTWTAATDNIGIAKYNIYRSTVAGFVPGPQNLVGSGTSASFTDHPAAGTYYYVVRAVDLAGNIGPASAEVSATVLADTTPPAVGIDGPTQGSTVAGVVTLTATASDNVSVAGVKFYVDGVQVGAEDVAAPYAFDWDSRSLANGTHTLTAVARDAAGNVTTSTAVTVTVANSSGLVAAYSFNEGSGLTAGDATGHGLNGSLSGGVAWTASGKFGGALSFDGINDIVNIADADALDLTTGMTLEAWVRPTSLSGYRTVMLKDVPGELSYSLYASGDVNLPNAWVRVNDASQDATGSFALPLNTWSFLAATYDGTTLRLFVNGSEVANRIIGGAIDTSDNPLHIGGNAIWGEYFAGLIDNVRIYNRPLTAAQIQTDMNAPVVNGAGGAAVEEVAAVMVAAVPADALSDVVESVAPATSGVAVFNTSVPIETRKASKRRNASVLAGEDVKVDRNRAVARRGGVSAGKPAR